MPNEYYVTKNGVPCTLDKSMTLHYKGLLRQCGPNEQPFSGIGFSAGKKKMNRAIKRTEEAIKKIQSSVIAEWDKIKWLTQPGAFTVEKRKVSTEAARWS